MVANAGTNISIRHATANDAGAITGVFLASRATMTYLPRLHTEAGTRAFIGRVVKELETYVALEAGHVVGFAVLRADWLEHLYVKPPFRNRGAGSALFGKVKEQRPDGFQFWVFQVNNGARRFYERHGCKTVEFTDGEHNEETLPDVRYEWNP